MLCCCIKHGLAFLNQIKGFSLDNQNFPYLFPKYIRKSQPNQMPIDNSDGKLQILMALAATHHTNTTTISSQNSVLIWHYVLSAKWDHYDPFLQKNFVDYEKYIIGNLGERMYRCLLWRNRKRFRLCNFCHSYPYLERRISSSFPYCFIDCFQRKSFWC